MTNTEFIDAIQKQLPGFLVGGGAGFIASLWSGFSKRIFEEWDRKAKHKLNVAIEIHKICNEARTGHYAILPRSMEHVNSIVTDVWGIDKKMGVAMEEFVQSWILNADPSFDIVAFTLKTEIKNATERQKKILENYQRLTGWANKIRAGGKPR